MYPQYDSLPDRILRINNHIAIYLRNPTPTWLAVQKAKSAGVHLVYYYEPVDQYIHFASNGIPVHDQHYFDSEAAFFWGEDYDVVDREEGAVVLSQSSDSEDEVGNEEGKEERFGESVDPGGGGDAAGAEGSCVWSEYDWERDLYQPFGVVEQLVMDWKDGACDRDFALMAVPDIAGEDMSDMGDWQEEWDDLYR